MISPFWSHSSLHSQATAGETSYGFIQGAMSGGSNDSVMRV
jgi:hypothetical protein